MGFRRGLGDGAHRGGWRWGGGGGRGGVGDLH